MDVQYKCRYCRYLINSQCQDYLEHDCFQKRLSAEKNVDLVLVADEHNILELVESTQEAVLDTGTPSTSQPSEIPAYIKINDESLIAAVYARKALWDHRTPLGQRTTIKVKDLWQQVANEIEGSFSIEVLKKRWRQLRDDFMRAKKKVKTYIPSGSGAADVPDLSPVFRHYHVMKFLDDVDDITTISNIQLDSSCETSASPSTCGTPDLQSPSLTPSQRRKRKAGGATVNDAAELQREMLKALQVPEAKPDGVDGFLLLLGEGLRRLPYRNRATLQIKFLQILEEESQSLQME